jgi:ribose transport system permease protein
MTTVRTIPAPVPAPPPPTSRSATVRLGSAAARRAVARYPLVPVIITMALFFEFATGSFLGVHNLLGIATDSATLAIVAIPMALLVISGYLDLSVGSTYALGAVAAGWLAAGHDGGLVASALLALAAGLAVGAVNGGLCCGLGLSPFIVTLGTLTAVRGLAQQLAPLPLTGFGDAFAWLGGARLAGVPSPLVLSLVVLLAGAVVLTLTPVGRHIYAIGVSREAAYLSGVKVRTVPFGLFLATGACAALAGALKASVLGAVQSGTAGLGFELAVLTAVLIGGVALTGGSGSLLGVVLGVVFLGVLQNGLTLLGVPTFWQQVAQGTALVVAAGLAYLSPRLEALTSRRPRA